MQNHTLTFFFLVNLTLGSSTACILSLCKLTGTLRASNLGDSAYLLIRGNRCIYESPSQQHFWNCPYQLTVLPPGYPGAGAYVMDMPKDAAQTTHQLQDGDVIVLATDGFWDNVFTKEAIELVDRELGDVITSKDTSSSVEDVVGRVRALSQRLTNTARRFSQDQKRLTPFSQGARHIRAGGYVSLFYFLFAATFSRLRCKRVRLTLLSLLA